MPKPAMPQIADKVVDGRLVPSARFDLDPARLTTIARSQRVLAASKSAKGGLKVARIEHPFVKSIDLQTLENPATLPALPVVTDSVERIMKDSLDPALRWVLPAIRARQLKATDPDAFRVIEEGLDESGVTVFSAVLSVPLETWIDSQVHARAKQEKLPRGGTVTTKNVPLKAQECMMHVTHNVAGEIEKTTINGNVVDDGKRAEFRLRGPAVALAFDALTAVGEGGLEIEVLAGFAAYRPVKQAEVEALEKVVATPTRLDVSKAMLQQMQASGQRVEISRGLQMSALQQNKGFLQALANARQERTTKMIAAGGTQAVALDRIGARQLRALQPGRIGPMRDGGSGIVLGRPVPGFPMPAPPRPRQGVPIIPTGLDESNPRIASMRQDFEAARRRIEKMPGSRRMKRSMLAKLKLRFDRMIAELLNGQNKPAPPQPPQRRLAKTRQVMNYGFVFEIDPTRQARHLVLERDGSSSRINAANPPWAGSMTTLPDKPFRRLGPNELTLPDGLEARVDVYESIIEPGRYLLVPNRYVIAREPETGRAAVSAQPLTDPDKPDDNSVVFKLGMGPDLDLADEFEIAAAVATRIAGKMAEGHEPYPFYLEFPSETGEPVSLQWPDALAQVFEPVIDGKHLIVTLQARTLTAATAMFDALTRAGNSVTGGFVVNLSVDQQIQVGMVANLRETTGASLAIEPVEGADTQYLLTDLLGYPQNVTEVVQTSDAGIERAALSPGIAIDADGEATVTGPARQVDGQIAVRAQPLWPDELVVDNTRYDIGTVMATLLLSTQLQAGVPLGDSSEIPQTVAFEIEAEGLTETSYAMNVENDMFMPIVLNWNLPLARHLTPDQRVLRYRARVTMVSGREVFTAWADQNFGNDPDIALQREQVLASIGG